MGTGVGSTGDSGKQTGGVVATCVPLPPPHQTHTHSPTGNSVFLGTTYLEITKRQPQHQVQKHFPSFSRSGVAGRVGGRREECLP